MRVERDAAGREFETAVSKEPQTTAVFLGERGFAGDASFDPSHRTPNMIVHAFSLDHYPHYEALANRTLPIPTFGENLSLVGGRENAVCIGDVYRLGTARVQISQPTERCGTPGRALGLPELRKWIHACLFSGFYLRVLEPGWVRAGDELALIERPLAEWTVDRVNRALFRELDDEALFDEIHALPLLSGDWKDRMRVLRARRREA